MTPTSAPGKSAQRTAGAKRDRAAAVRAAMRALVAERGLAGASMSAVAERAGVATGTAYVHYPSKDELVLAAYRETKRELGEAAVANVDGDDPPAERFRALWFGVHDHLAADPVRARFLLAVQSSPLALTAHEGAAEDDPLLAAAAAPDMAGLLIDVPLEVVYELGLGPAIRLAAVEPGLLELGGEGLETLAAACWRAITMP